ncbi:MAG: hypothetical protein ACRD6W_09305, partial [Nitrososphaerales archaeon]
ASPLFAGLLTLLMGSEKGSLGLLNPSLYKLAGNSFTYQKAFTPITFGYTIPWVSSLGYNLATGWGAPNIGEIAGLYGSLGSSSALSVSVEVSNSGNTNFTDFAPGQSMDVVATVSAPGGSAVTTGDFNASLQTLGGTTSAVPLTYDADAGGWTGTITVGNEAGVADVNVVGNSAGESGEGFAATFVGYLANFAQPLGPYPWTYLPGLVTAASITDLFGTNAPFISAQVVFENYSILSNKYTPEASAALPFSTSGDGYFEATLNESLSSGPTAIVAQGPVAGYLPFVSGISLLGSDVYPEVVAEPGSVAPGQSLTIVATVTAPENIYLIQSLSTGSTLGATIAGGANVTASLVNPSGTSVETVSLLYQTCAQALRVCGGGLSLMNGYMTIPENASAGLYTVVLNAAYNDETTGFNYTGSYFGEVYVSPGVSIPKISIGPSTLFEGENASITASITSPDGNAVTSGIYTALVYPEAASGNYSSIMHSAYAAYDLVPLTFDAKTGLWTGSVTMPSPYN